MTAPFMDQTPEQTARAHAEATKFAGVAGNPYHRHFASAEIHRDNGPECNQFGTPRRVWVFDTYALEAHEKWITERTRQETIAELDASPASLSAFVHFIHQQGFDIIDADDCHLDLDQALSDFLTGEAPTAQAGPDQS